MDQVKVNLEDNEIPKQWYNILADMPTPMSPPLHPGTGKPVGPDDLAPVFPMNLIEQGDLMVGFRPETFLPADFVGDAEEVVRYPFEVTWMEYLGAERLVYGNVGEKSHALHVVSRLPGNVSLPVEVGRTYPFAVPRRELRFFDRTSGLRTDREPV